MRSFRPPTPDAAPEKSLNLLAVGQLIDDAMQPGHCYVDPQLHLTWIAGRSETIAWEIFRGRLLDAAHTREQKTFLSWHVIEENEAHPATESLISVKLDVQGRQIHVTRGLLAYAWEGYDAGGGVIESREAIRWTRELVGTIRLDDFADLESVRDELICLLWQAVVGTSRLPLTSVEAPLPAFSFGQFHYVNRKNTDNGPMTSWAELLACCFQPQLAQHERVKLIEFILRAVNTQKLLCFLEAYGRTQVISAGLWRAMFDSVSLSPYTHFVENALISLDLGAELEKKIDFHAHLLRRLSRHLTAYDLVTFHHRGANYPDALLLDTVLKRYLGSVTRFPEFFLGDNANARMRRRAFRQACLLRRHYEGHLVPDLPTSPGENARVMPATHPRVPEEQLLQPTRRRRQLYADDPLSALLTPRARTILVQSVADLEHLDERVEMGLGVFIDRPLGYAKAPGEPDQTPLLAHEAYSPSLARRRWQELQRLCAELELPFDPAVLQPHFENGAWPGGLPHAELAPCPRPTAALTDVRQVADDFVVLRSLPAGAAQLMGLFDWRALEDRFSLRFLREGAVRLCLQGLNDARQPVLVVYDAQLRRRLEMIVDVSQGHMSRAGVETPRAGLRVVAVWEDRDDPAGLVRRDTYDVIT